MTKPVFLSTSMILIRSAIYQMNYWNYYLEQSVNINNDKNVRLNVDSKIEQAFRFMKTRFDYDDKQYMKRVNANRLNGKKNSKKKEKVFEPNQIEPNGVQ